MNLQNEQWKKGLLTRGMVLLASMVLFLGGCGSRKEEPIKNNGAESSEQQESGPEQNQEQNQMQGQIQSIADGYRTGLAVETSMLKSLDADGGEGTAQVDTLAVAVLLDEEGRIGRVFYRRSLRSMPSSACICAWKCC